MFSWDSHIFWTIHWVVEVEFLMSAVINSEFSVAMTLLKKHLIVVRYAFFVLASTG